MKKYVVTVNGVKYEVELETADASEIKTPAAPAAAPAVAPAGANTVKSPLPGTVLAVKCNAGDTVKKGQILFIVEAMKMENEILAPADAKIASVAVTKGASVESGSVLCVLA